MVVERSGAVRVYDEAHGYWIVLTCEQARQRLDALVKTLGAEPLLTTEEVDAAAKRADDLLARGAAEQLRPRVVCLCGSMRFYDAFQKANYEETMAGRIVLSVGYYPHSAQQAHGESVGCTPEQKVALDELHKRKIDLSDEILVLNVGGYVGDSTRGEVEYAKAHGKPIRWLEEGWYVCAWPDCAKLAKHGTDGWLLCADHRGDEPKPSKRHRWDRAGERCLDCGDKDWMGGECSGQKSNSPACKLCGGSGYIAHSIRGGQVCYQCHPTTDPIVTPLPASEYTDLASLREWLDSWGADGVANWLDSTGLLVPIAKVTLRRLLDDLAEWERVYKTPAEKDWSPEERAAVDEAIARQKADEEKEWRVVLAETVQEREDARKECERLRKLYDNEVEATRKAAEMLGVPESTLRVWLKREGK